MRTILVLVLAVLAQAAGNTFLSRAMEQVGARIGERGGLSIGVILHAVQAPLLWLGILLLIVYFAFFLLALLWQDLSFVLPALSFTYLLTVAFAHFFLHEHVSALRWLGTVLIVLGVALVTKTARPELRTEGAKTDASAGPGSPPC